MSKLLAWNILPLPKGTYYTEADLVRPEKVLEVFNACKEHDAVIVSEGWSFLFHTHTVAVLVGMCRQVGWFEDTQSNALLENLINYALHTGYNPVTDHFGTYSMETGMFSAGEVIEETNRYWGNLTVDMFELQWSERRKC